MEQSPTIRFDIMIAGDHDQAKQVCREFCFEQGLCVTVEPVSYVYTGGAGYWNMIRKHFPEQFDRMATLSRRLGARLIKQDGQRVFLDELRPTTGRQKDEVTIECSSHCGDVISQFEAT